MSADRLVLPRGAERVGEAERLATMARLGLTQPATIATFDALVHTLRLMTKVAAAYVVVIDSDTLTVWSGHGDAMLSNVPRSGSFSEEVVRAGRSLVVTDAGGDPRFVNHPLVNGDRCAMRLYVGIPLATSTGAVLGTLCGFDDADRPPPDDDTIRMLEELATTAVAELELACANAELACQEKVLLDRTEILETTFDNITEGVTIFDGDLRLVGLNRKAIEILGLPPGSQADPENVDLAPPARAGFYGSGEPEDALRMRHGRLRSYLDTRPQPPLPDTELDLADGRTVRRRLRQMTEGFLTTYVDLSDLRCRQAQLLAQARYFELQHKLAMLSNSAPDLRAALRRVVDLNLDELNGAVGTVWRRTGDRLVPEGILRLAGRPDLHGEAEAALAAGLLRPSPLALRSAATGVMTYTTPDDPDRGDVGCLRPAEDLRTGYAIPLRVLDEVYVVEFYGPVGIGPKSWHKDIIKDLECQLDQVAERDRARRSKAEFISTVSHELRTPLTSMRGMLELLESGLFGALPDETAQRVERASTDSRVLGTLIEDVLAIHDIQHGDVEAEPRRADLRSVLQAAARRTDILVDMPGEDHDLRAVFDGALLDRGLVKLATAVAAPGEPALVSARRRGRAVRLVAEGPPGRPGRAVAGGSVALRLAACLFERAGGSVADRSGADRMRLQVDLPVEVLRPARTVLPDEFARSLAEATARPSPTRSVQPVDGTLLQASAS